MRLCSRVYVCRRSALFRLPPDPSVRRSSPSPTEPDPYHRLSARYYLSTSRELKRLDSTTKSPIFASFQETLGGVATIRAYGQTERFVAENEARIDRNQEAYFPSINCNRCTLFSPAVVLDLGKN